MTAAPLTKADIERVLTARIRALEAQLREAQIDAAKERSLSEVYIRQRDAAEARVRELEAMR